MKLRSTGRPIRRDLARLADNPYVVTHPDQLHQLPDGRMLAWCEYGIPTGTPTLLFHGAPGSRIDSRLIAGAIATAGLRVITADRPGFGRSSRVSGTRTYLAWADDVARLADHLGIGDFAVLAYSAGGPYALATCQALGARVRRAAIVSGVATSEMPDFRKGLAPTDKAMLLLAPRAPWLARMAVGKALSQARRRPEKFVKALDRDFSSPADRSVLDSELRSAFPELFLEAGRQGPAGLVEDFAVWAQPSGLNLQGLTTPIHLWHGEDDRTIPSAHSRWLASEIGSADLTIWPGVGHLHTAECWSEALAALAGE